ncbi:hypothetical protein H6F77_18255 [Microcoleus sp. FACHB-831]|uniref:hypothetical protein n=1 Tax=Microcoleus sp. FACHB-831 TaxID=2692827 RepID=UPI001687DFB1|nr:hypothetical protein [Microcoleus sp. FACHB-831]MBD1922999.1 hypothetical protein [Microcoleus sp. FACHB-831]
MTYRVNKNFKIYCGFDVDGQHIITALSQTNNILETLPASVYKSIDYKTTSSIVGSIFCETLATATCSIVNPIEKGHPDIIPSAGINSNEEVLRNYPAGLEVKSTVGNVTQGANLRAGQTRIKSLNSITWQAHHREVRELLGLVWDFVKGVHEFNYPKITAVFYANDLVIDDWGEISGTTGRNTKVTGMRVSGKLKMGKGWVAVLDDREYIVTYQKLLNFIVK